MLRNKDNLQGMEVLILDTISSRLDSSCYILEDRVRPIMADSGCLHFTLTIE